METINISPQISLISLEALFTSDRQDHKENRY